MKTSLIVLEREFKWLRNSWLPIITLLFLIGSIVAAYMNAFFTIPSDILPRLIPDYQRSIITLVVGIAVIAPLAPGKLISAIWGASIIAREYETHTLNNLASLPVRRNDIAFGKTISILIITSLMALLYGIGGYLISSILLGPPPMDIVLYAIFVIFVYLMFVFLLGQFISSISNSTIMAVILTLTLTYIFAGIGMLFSDIYESIGVISLISPDFSFNVIYMYLFWDVELAPVTVAFGIFLLYAIVLECAFIYMVNRRDI